MDLSNLKGLLDANESVSPEVSDDDLEDELNAILSGKLVPQRTKTTAPSANPVVKRVKQNELKLNKSEESRKRRNRSNDHHQEPVISTNMINIDNFGAFDDFNSPEDDISDDDESNEELLSEISAIATNEPKVTHQTFSPVVRPPNTDVPQFSGSMVGHLTPEQTQKPSSPQRNALIVGEQNLISKDQKAESNLNDSKKQIPENDKVTEGKSEIPKLIALKDEYRRSALMAKKNGHQDMALSHVKTAKQIEVLIKALEDGLSVDLSQLPPPPGNEPKITPSTDGKPDLVPEVEDQEIEMTTEDVKKFFNAPPPPNTTMEALEQRLSKFKSTLDQANSENNASKARRLGRIVKQYENAIKDFKKGKAMNFEELPTPPGFGPIPVGNEPKSVAADSRPKASSSVSESKLEPVIKPSPESKVSPTRSQSSGQKSARNSDSSSDQRPALKRASSTANKQLNYLLERQRLFKEAALESKQKGDIQQAKEYLRMAKGFDPLIEATQNGLPIDATSIPTPPQMSEDFVVVSHPQTTDDDDLEREELFRKIEVEFQNQIEMCKRNKEYFLQLGDISTASKFEKYGADSRKDLDLLIIRWRNGQRVPEVKHETRTFSIVICNTEVTTNEVSVEVVKAVDIPAKSDVDTYVRLEFPFPNDRNQTARTKTVKNSVNPVFNETFRFEIDRKSRQLPRVLKRHPLKLELISKGGFLRSDSLIGTALIKLTDFETKCTIHESFPLTEGRKTIGGRIEAKVKIREPLLAKQVEEVKEKWLSFV